jgi:hypothetical protein
MKVKFKNQDKEQDVKVVVSRSSGVRTENATVEHVNEYLNHLNNNKVEHTHSIQDGILYLDQDAPTDGTVRLFII